MECELCKKNFIKTIHNQRFCSLECQRLNNQREWCKKNKEHLKQYREKTKKKRNQRRRENYHQNNELRKKIIKQSKLYRLRNPFKKKDYDLKKLYGISLLKFQEILKKQKGKCAICGYTQEKNNTLFPVVDHCHKKNIIRGLLCMNCNQGLGKFKDNIIFLKKAINYLKKYEKKNNNLV